MRHRVADQIAEVLRGHVISQPFRHDRLFLSLDLALDVLPLNRFDHVVFAFERDRIIVLGDEDAGFDAAILEGDRAHVIRLAHDAVGIEDIDE